MFCSGTGPAAVCRVRSRYAAGDAEPGKLSVAGGGRSAFPCKHLNTLCAEVSSENTFLSF